MSAVTFMWAMVFGACATMALTHLVVGLKDKAWANLVFAFTALGVAGIVFGELGVMHSTTTAEIGRAVQLVHIPLFVLYVGIVGFVAIYFGTGRLWLLVTLASVRVVMLVINFAVPPNVNFREITALRHFDFLGDTISMPVGLVGPGTRLGELSSLLLLAFVIDASISLWRRGGAEGRRRALVVGGSITFFIVLAAGNTALIHAGIIQMPYLISFPFLGVVGAMGFELSRDVLRAAQTARQLRISEAALREGEERMSLAAEAASLGMWVWHVLGDDVWMTEQGRALFGMQPEARVDLAALVDRVHPEDRASREAAIKRALETHGRYEFEYRVQPIDGKVRWISARGRCVATADGDGWKLLGVSMDVTARKQAELEAAQQRAELGHLSRVTLVGEMATSLAHELNQPITAMVTNASAAQRFIAHKEMDPAELRELLEDIAADGRRAGDVIRGIKGMVRKVVSERRTLEVNVVIADVLRLVRSDALAHNCVLSTELEPALPPIFADPVQLQQVLLNLIINAFEAMHKTPNAGSRVEVASRRADADTIEVAVRDFGPGLPAEGPDRVFESFFSTKSDGIGMGLAIARSIIEAHDGTLRAENVEGGGARFWFRIPAQMIVSGEAAA